MFRLLPNFVKNYVNLIFESVSMTTLPYKLVATLQTKEDSCCNSDIKIRLHSSF